MGPDEMMAVNIVISSQRLSEFVFSRLHISHSVLTCAGTGA
jgi:hypothetical protein